MRETKFTKEPTLYGKMTVETRYAVYFQASDEKAYPQKLGECTEDGIDETLKIITEKLEKNGLSVEPLAGKDDEFYVTGNSNGTEIDGVLYAGSYMIILNSAQKKAMERVFNIVRRPPNNNGNNYRRNNQGGRGNGYRR